MRNLNYQLKMLCKHSHEGSFKTRVGRKGEQEECRVGLQ